MSGVWPLSSRCERCGRAGGRRSASPTRSLLGLGWPHSHPGQSSAPRGAGSREPGEPRALLRCPVPTVRPRDPRAPASLVALGQKIREGNAVRRVHSSEQSVSRLAGAARAEHPFQSLTPSSPTPSPEPHGSEGAGGWQSLSSRAEDVGRIHTETIA